MSIVHKQIPVKVWADIDEAIASWVVYLNDIPGVRTYSSCQGTIGECGPEPYPAFVSVGWADESAKSRLASEFVLTEEGLNHGRVERRTRRMSKPQYGGDHG